MEQEERGDRMGRNRSRRAVVAAAVAGIAAFAALTACAPEVQETPAPEPSPAPETSEPEPYAGPVVFVGDELVAFALTPEEIVGIVPEATEITAVSPVLEQVSDGGGATAIPAICDALYLEQSLGSVGARTIDWTVPTDPDRGFGRFQVLQFADEAQAQTRMDQLLQAAQQCSQFTKDGPVTFDAVIPESAGDTRGFAGTLVDDGLGWRAFSAFASTGNVIVQLSQPFSGERTFDAEAAAIVLQTRAYEARQGLVDELTANPPAAEADPSGDPGEAWSDWQIGVGGVGPVRLGDALDSAVTASGADEIVEPSFDGGPWTLVDAGVTGSIQVQPAEGSDAVQSITVGNARTLDDAAQDGAALPARGDLRVGALVADAIAAFPGGTIVDVASSGDDYYEIATRDGQVFRFQSDRDVADAGATIVGITVEDATARGPLLFG